jgi:hypothetical protein
MNKALLAGLVASVVIAAGYSGEAEARCFRTGQHWACGHHPRHYAYPLHNRSWAAGYGYSHPYAYGWGYPYYGSSAYSAGSYGSSFGPRPSSDGGS